MSARMASGLALLAAVFAGCGGGGVDVDFQTPSPPIEPIRNTDFVARAPIDATSLPGSGRTRLLLTAINGAVVVEGAPGASRITISGERRVGSDSLADAQAYLPQLQVEVQEVGTDVLVRTRQPQDGGGRSFAVDYRIAVPEALELNIDGVNGSIQLSGMNSRVATSLVNGRTVSALRVPAGAAVDIRTVNGDIDLRLPLDTSAELSARVGIGSILVQDLIVNNEVRSNTTLRGTLGAGGATVTLETSNGSIAIDALI